MIIYFVTYIVLRGMPMDFFFYEGGDAKSIFILWIFLGGGCMGIGVPFEKCSPAVPRLNFFQISRQLSVFSRDLID